MAVKLQDTGQDSMDLGFELPESGVSVCQFEEGIQKRTNENSGKTTLQLPLVIVAVLEGPEDNEGKRMSHFCPIETSFGEKQLAGLLTMTGLVHTFAEKFGGEIEATNEKFVNALKLKLVGKTIRVTHDVRKDNKGRDQVNIVKFEKHDGGRQKSAAAKNQSSQPPEDEDW